MLYQWGVQSSSQGGGGDWYDGVGDKLVGVHMAEFEKYKLQKYRNTVYRNIEIELTEN